MLQIIDIYMLHTSRLFCNMYIHIIIYICFSFISCHAILLQHLNEVRACNINECGSWTSQLGNPLMFGC